MDLYLLKIKYRLKLCIIWLVLISPVAHATPVNDPHYTNAGFFDIHVCNWPNRPPFFLAVFSTTRFNDIDSIEVFLPDNKKLGNLNLTKFRLIQTKDKKEKRVFLKQFEIPQGIMNGWFHTKVNMKNGQAITAKDYVVLEKLEKASVVYPDLSHQLTTPPKKFKFKKVPGAQYYQVFIKDNWESKLIFSSKLLTKPELDVPKDLLVKGGLYTIQVHARDTNEHQLLGDFNHGSLTGKIEFSIAD